MNRPIIIANWKMNLSPKASVDLARFFYDNFNEITDKDVVICPSFVGLPLVGALMAGGGMQLGAQDIFWKNQGPYTGEISPEDLLDVGCRYVIIGHSERRQHLVETNDMVNKKIKISISNNLVPIICVGESLEDRKNNHADNIIYTQMEAALSGVELVGSEQIVVAYEPIWAIGTGQTVKPEEAEHIFSLIHQILIDHFPATIVHNNVRLVYGGSVDANTAKPFMAVSLLDGFLVGGASLKIKEFLGIVQNFSARGLPAQAGGSALGEKNNKN